MRRFFPQQNASHRPGASAQLHPASALTILVAALMRLAAVAGFGIDILGAQTARSPAAVWPLDQPCTVREDAAPGRLAIQSPYYTIEQDLRRGGILSAIRLTYGRTTNLLARPIEAVVVDAAGNRYSDANDPRPEIRRRQEGATQIITVDSIPRDTAGATAAVRVRTVVRYQWGYLRVRREFSVPNGGFRALELTPFSTVFDPSLTDFGYREGLTEDEGAPPFAFGSNRWGKLRPGGAGDPPLATPFVPRSMLFANPGVEGIEWFVGSDLAQWDTALTGRRGRGWCTLRPVQSPTGLALTIAAYHSTNAAIAMPRTCAFDFYLGLPLLDGHARRPWLHSSFNRNRGDWVSSETVRQWATNGLQTVHCHNDGDYYDDGLFWRDGAYPPYPDMARYNQVIEDCHRAGIRVATYFSNKELHPATREYLDHGTAWGRSDRQGKLQHNLYRGTNEFGVQMCLRSGWSDFLKFSIDRVLKNHPLDGVYYDWNVALLCCNPRHTGAPTSPPANPEASAAPPHWDIDELIDFMEWTRRRVGPDGLVIVHNTTTPMFVTENFADYVVANEWGYGQWKETGPDLVDLPLEWSLVGARSRGVISYGQLNSQSPRRLHRLFALEALLGGVTPWPASPETFELAAILDAIGDIESCRFADWRNPSVSTEGRRCASAVYSRPSEAFILMANLDPEPQEVKCTVRPDRLPHPLAHPTSAAIIRCNPNPAATATNSPQTPLDLEQLLGPGTRIALPADGAVLVRLR